MNASMHAHLEQLLDTGIPLTGNTGKVRTLIELSRLIKAQPGLSILDVGCIGPAPLEFWRPLWALHEGQFQLTGIDPNVAGIEQTQARLADLTRDPVTLLAGNGYDLTRLFPAQQFDVIIFTQVLEHVFRYQTFLHQVREVCRPDGQVLFTLDSGHYPHRRLIKDTIKGVLVRLGHEHHYEHGWRDDELAPILAQTGFEIVAQEYYCTAPIKKMHNHYVTSDQKNACMRTWFEQEYFLNQQTTFDEAAKRQFLILYYHVRRHSAIS